MTQNMGGAAPSLRARGEEPRATLLAFLPSEGLGGGIERYCNWLLAAVEEAGVRVVRVALLQPGSAPSLSRKVRFLLRSIRTACRVRGDGSVLVLVCHPSLAVATLIAVRLARLRPARSHVLFHGEDIWTFGRLPARIVRRWRARPLTVSSFSAGAVSGVGCAPVIAPGIERAWFDALSSTDRPSEPSRSEKLRVLSVFRLDSAVSKGLPEVLDALERVRRSHPCHLTVAGSGALPPEVAETVARLPWVSVVQGPPDEGLARLYASADVFVLATRTRSTPPTSGEGFGIVLVEAQLAGTPVVVPAFGGSDDAFVPGLTGLKPIDESADALAGVLGQLASDPALRKRLGDNAKSWTQATFDPDRRSLEARQLLFGESGLARARPLGLSVVNVPLPGETSRLP